MLYTEITINGETYKLRLNTRTSIQLEKSLGYNPINILMDMTENKMPKMSDTITMFHAMLQCYHHGITLDKAMDLFDDYVAEGKSMFDLLNVFMEVFRQSGYMSGMSTEEDAKN